MVGIEPTTDGLRNRCSTAELHWHSGAHRQSESALDSSTTTAAQILQRQSACCKQVTGAVLQSDWFGSVLNQLARIFLEKSCNGVLGPLSIG